jgi:hypothetical protein
MHQSRGSPAYERIILTLDLMHNDGNSQPSALADCERSPAIHRRGFGEK